MRCLWLTLADPVPPTNGQFLYSDGLIGAVAGAGCRLTVVGLARAQSPPRPAGRDGIAWRLVPDQSRPAWRSLTSPLPHVTQRCRTPAMIRLVDAVLAEDAWDAVVFDSIALGWALGAVLRKRDPARTAIAYLSHNHETTVARHVADAASGLSALWKRADAIKVARLERALVGAADLITANTPEDCATFAAVKGGPVPFMPPGYNGVAVPRRTFDAALPRRAVVVGSFDWPPKRLSLEAFLTVAAPIFAAAGIELQIVGSAEADYLAGLRQRFATVEFTGPVADVRPYMAQARLALVPDLLGGFKLKALDYVFNRLPIFAMRIAVPGMPLQEGRDIALFDSHADLAQGVVAAIDDLAALDAQQDSALIACGDRFDWRRIGRDLVEALATARHAARPAGQAASEVARANAC